MNQEKARKLNETLLSMKLSSKELNRSPLFLKRLPSFCRGSMRSSRNCSMWWPSMRFLEMAISLWMMRTLINSCKP
ncbi:hypothetical protein ACSBR2_016915 [Camellia fascicularis]